MKNQYIGDENNYNIVHIKDKTSNLVWEIIDFDTIKAINKQTSNEYIFNNIESLYSMKDLFQDNLFSKIDTMGVRTNLVSFYGQSGTLSIPNTYDLPDGFANVSFLETFLTRPLLFSIANEQGSDAATINFKTIDNSFVEATLIEPPAFDGPHAPQTVPYISFLPGIYQLGSLTFEIGYIETTKVVGDFADPANTFGWERITTHTTFNNPGMMVFLQSDNNQLNDIPRVASNPWKVATCKKIDNFHFDITMDMGQTNGKITVPEKIAYMIFELNQSTSFIDGNGKTVTIETFNSSANGWDDGWSTFNFKTSFSATPLVIAGVFSRNDSRGGWLRYNSSTISSSSVQFTIDCDTAQNTARSHNNEDVVGIAISSSFVAKK